MTTDPVIRVTHVITRMIAGGAQENTLSSVLGLREKPGLQLRLISGPSPGAEGTLEPQAAAVPGLLHVLPNLVRPVSPWHDSRAYRALVHHFRNEPPDIVHTHSGKAGVLGRLAAAKARVPLIIHTIHGPSFGPFQGRTPNAIFRTAERVAGRRTHHFVVVANAMTRQYLAAGIGRPEQYTCIRSGFDLAPFATAVNDPELRLRLGLDPSDVVVGMIARLSPLKGHEDLFAVIPTLSASNRRLKFLLIGDGPLRADFETRVRRTGIAGRIKFAGLVSATDIPRYVGVMDMLAHLSRREGLPRAVAQALAGGRPVVAYDTDGTSEVCIDGKTGFLIQPGDLAAVTDRIGQLAMDSDLRHRLGARGKSMIHEMFPVQKMVDDLHTLYLKLASERDLRAPGALASTNAAIT